MDGWGLMPEQGSTTASQVDALYWALIGLSVFFIAIIVIPMLFFLIKYRRGSTADRTKLPPGTVKTEISWILGLVVIALIFFVWSAATFFRIQTPPRNALEIQVIGKQWMWKLQHPQGKREINELHVPVGRPVRLLMTSQDVIHSFYIPAFRIKQDVLPGKLTSTWFTATKPGVYHLFCAEYCGTKHSGMIGQVIAMEPADYEAWLRSGEQGQSVMQAGAALFRSRGCSGCHAEGSQIRAPRLEGVYGRPVPLQAGGVIVADEQYIRDSILLPGNQIVAGYENLMPSYQGMLNESELLQLIAYIKSLGVAGEEAPVAGGAAGARAGGGVP